MVRMVMMIVMIMIAKSGIGMDPDGSLTLGEKFRILSEVQASELASCAHPPPWIIGETSVSTAPSCIFTSQSQWFQWSFNNAAGARLCQSQISMLCLNIHRLPPLSLWSGKGCHLPESSNILNLDRILIAHLTLLRGRMPPAQLGRVASSTHISSSRKWQMRTTQQAAEQTSQLAIICRKAGRQSPQQIVRKYSTSWIGRIIERLEDPACIGKFHRKGAFFVWPLKCAHHAASETVLKAQLPFPQETRLRRHFDLVEVAALKFKHLPASSH